MKIEILGTGCPKCHALDDAVNRAVAEIGLKDAVIEHIQDIDRIIEYGVILFLHRVIDGEVKLSGRVQDKRS